jgi:hypothetical protein
MKKYANILINNAIKILITYALFAFNIFSAPAVLVTIEPDNYAENSFLNNISPHVSLFTAGANNLPIPFDVTSKEDFFNAPTGAKVFSHAGVGFWNSDRRLLMTFSSPIDSVSIDFAGGTHFASEIGYLDAFDINKAFLFRYSTGPLKYGEIERMSVSGSGIAYAVAYIPPSFGNFGRLDNLTFNVISLLDEFKKFNGTYIGNFRTTYFDNPIDELLRNGQVLTTLNGNRQFSGALLINGSKAGFRGKFDVNGNWSGQVTLAGHTVEIEMLLEGGELGNRVTGTLGIDGVNQEDAASFVCLPVFNTGFPGDEFELAGAQINAVLMSEGISGKSFGHGYAMGKCGKDGVVRFTGRLADNTAWSGAARVVRDEVEGLRLPIAVALTTVRGLLIGEATINTGPDEGELHLQSNTPWRWVRSANSKSKTFAQGFVEELGVMGQVWSWTKGTSVLGGSSANFTLTLSAPSGFKIAAGAESLSGSLGASNKPTWTSAPPKGFTMKIMPASGLVSGNLPGTLDGKAAVLSYWGLIFPGDMELDSGTPVRGAGFISGRGASGTMEIIVP